MSKAGSGKNKAITQQQSIAPLIEDIDEKTAMLALFSDTICTKDYGHSSWEAMYKFFEESKVTQRTMIVDDTILVSNITSSDVANFFLHRIAATPRLLPYIDMVRWVVDNLSIFYWRIITSKHTVIGYFTNEDLQ